MNPNEGETISALLDGELGQAETQRAVSSLLAAGTDELGRFGRYRLVGDLMRGESVLVDGSLVGRVREALEAEPHILAPRPARRQWLRPLAGAAMAASVAAAAIMVAPQLLGPTTGPGGAVQVAAAPPPVPASAVRLVAAGEGAGPRTAESAPRWRVLDQDLAERLDRLVIEHHEFGGRTGINGPVAHIGLVSYGAR